MKKLGKNPLAWFVLVIVFGYIAVVQGETDNFIVFGFAVVVAKLIEVINKLEKN